MDPVTNGEREKRPGMTPRELVKAALAHEETERVPYCIGFTKEGREALQTHVDSISQEGWCNLNADDFDTQAEHLWEKANDGE